MKKIRFYHRLVKVQTIIFEGICMHTGRELYVDSNGDGQKALKVTQNELLTLIFCNILCLWSVQAITTHTVQQLYDKQFNEVQCRDGSTNKQGQGTKIIPTFPTNDFCRVANKAVCVVTKVYVYGRLSEKCISIIGTFQPALQSMNIFRTTTGNYLPPNCQKKF